MPPLLTASRKRFASTKPMPTTCRYCKSDYPTPDCKKKKSPEHLQLPGLFLCHLSVVRQSDGFSAGFISRTGGTRTRDTNGLFFLCAHITLYQLSYSPMESKSLRPLLVSLTRKIQKKLGRFRSQRTMIFTPTTLFLAESHSGNSGGLVAEDGPAPSTSWV